MRLATAASILAQTLPTIASEVVPRRVDIVKQNVKALKSIAELQKKELPWDENDSNKKHHDVSKRTNKPLHHHDDDKAGFLHSSRNVRRLSGCLQNDKRTSSKVEKVKKERDPTTVPADIGVLACDGKEHEYCMESKFSSLGGICVPLSSENNADDTSRNMQAFYADYTCTDYYGDGDEFMYGSCSYDEYCFQPCNTPCVYLDVSLTSDTVNGELYQDVSYCYDFTSPYEQSLCIDISYTVSGPKCRVLFNGQSCSYCRIDGPCASCDYEGYTGCTYADCGNVPGGKKTSICNAYFAGLAPIYKTRYDLSCDFNATNNYYPCDPCDGGEMTNPAGVVDFLNISCSGLSYYGSIGFITEALCPVAQIFSQEPCRCVSGNSTFFACPVCSNGNRATNPNEIVYVPTIGQNSSCALLDSYLLYSSALGIITQDNCPMVQSLVEGPCGCTVPSTPAPVDQMAPAPISSMTPAPIDPMTPAPIDPMTPAPIDPINPAPMSLAPIDLMTPAPMSEAPVSAAAMENSTNVPMTSPTEVPMASPTDTQMSTDGSGGTNRLLMGSKSHLLPMVGVSVVVLMMISFVSC